MGDLIKNISTGCDVSDELPGPRFRFSIGRGSPAMHKPGPPICESLAQLQAIAAQAVDVPSMLAALPSGVAAWVSAQPAGDQSRTRVSLRVNAGMQP